MTKCGFELKECEPIEDRNSIEYSEETIVLELQCSDHFSSSTLDV